MVAQIDRLPYTKSEAKAWGKRTIVDFYQTPLTPFTSDYKIDEAGIRKNVDSFIEMGVTGLVVGGFIAEAWTLTMDDWKRYHEVYAEAVDGRMPLHTIALDPSVYVTLEKMDYVETLGYVGAEVINPIVQFKTDDEIFNWYKYLTDHSDLAVFLYRTPVSGKVLSLELIARLAEIPTVIGVKQGSLNHTDSIHLRRMVPDNFIVSDPMEFWFLDDLRHGGQVFWASFEYIVYGKQRHLLREYTDLARDGQWEEARTKWEALRPADDLVQVVTKAIATTASYASVVPFIKAWWDLLGLEVGGGRMLPPVEDLPAERKQWLAARLSDAGII